MYLSYYKLSKKPFQITTDPSFFWLGERHKEALSILKYGVMDDKGFLLLTGDVGTGKTTLINAFVNSLGDEVIVSRVSDPGLTQLDFINYIAKLFKIETAFETKSEFLILFTEFLEQADREDKKVLLIIDEAQHLTDETLEELRLLSNIENQDKKLLNIFLVGQSEFNEILEKYKNRALRQRLTLNYTLYPFEAEETKACIEYRLRVAGAENEIFTTEAIDLIHTISNGFPRVINIICDHALRLGCQEEQKSISAAIINQCSKALHAAHLPQSHQYESHFGSANEWLEESEVPPLSPEAINRASQPLSEFILDDKADIKEKVRPYSAIVPLFLAGLLISGFFLFKDDNLDSVSQFLTNLYTDTITPTAQKLRSTIDSSEIVQKAEKLFLSETIPASSSTLTPLVVIPKKQKKKILESKVSEEVTETEIPEIDSQGTNQEQQIMTISEMVQVVDQPGINAPADPKTSSDELDDVDAKMLQQEPVASDVTVPLTVIIEGNTSEEIKDDINTEPLLITEPRLITEPEPSFTQIPMSTEKTIFDEPETTEAQSEDVFVDVEIDPPSISENGTPVVGIEIKDFIQVISDAVSTESSNITEVLSDDVQGEDNVESELIEEPPQPPVTQTPTIVEKDIENKKQPSPQPEVESIPQVAGPAVVQSRVKSEPQTPPPSSSSSKEPSDTNDDPGAVIDWLLKSKQN